MMEFLFWLAVFLLLYTYLGFPLILMLRARVLPKPAQSADITPSVSLIIAAHNEAGVIQNKIENILALDYPKNRLEVLIASDGSDDGTNEIVAQYQDRGISLLALPRQGKIPTLNAAVARAQGEILAFSDANSMFAAGSLRALMRPFADARVGGVAGDQRYLKTGSASSTASGEHAYWNVDRQLKRWESQAGNVISATGAIYAMRRMLFKPLPGGVCDDAMNSYQVMAQGARVVFEPQAVAYERVAPSENAEFRRKVRVATRGMNTLRAACALLNPFRFKFVSVQLVSHKLLRWLAFWPLAVLFLTSFRLASVSGFYAAAAALQSAFYSLAACIWMLRTTPFISGRLARAMTLPFYFCLANVAFLAAQFKILRGQRIDSWEVKRAELARTIGQPATPR